MLEFLLTRSLSSYINLFESDLTDDDIDLIRLSRAEGHYIGYVRYNSGMLLQEALLELTSTIELPHPITGRSYAAQFMDNLTSLAEKGKGVLFIVADIRDSIRTSPENFFKLLRILMDPRDAWFKTGKPYSIIISLSKTDNISRLISF